MARKIVVQIVGDATSLERSFRKAGDASDRFGKRIGVSAKTFAKAGAVGAAAGGVALVTKQLFASVRAAKESEAAAARLDAAFDQARVSAQQRARAQQAISRISKTAALDDEDLSDALARLTRTSGSAAKGTKDLALAANIARARQISLAAAAKIVEKARVGQLRGLKAIGVEINKNTSSEEALERAQRKFAGSAERYGKTAAGAQDKLSVAFENLQERVGAKLTPVITKLTLKLVDLIDWSERNWPKFSAAIKKAVDLVRPIIQYFVDRIENVVKVIKGVVRLVDAIAHGEWGKAWAAFKDVVSNVLKGIYKSFLELPRKVLAALGAKAWRGLEAVGSTIKNAALGGLTGLKDALVGALTSAINAMIRLVNKAIAAYNKIPIAPDLPKISEVGGGGTGRSRPSSGLTTRPDEGTRGRFAASASRQLQSTGLPSISLHVDGRELGRVVIGRTQRAGRETAASRRGPFAGQRLALG